MTGKSRKGQSKCVSTVFPSSLRSSNNEVVSTWNGDARQRQKKRQNKLYVHALSTLTFTPPSPTSSTSFPRVSRGDEARQGWRGRQGKTEKGKLRICTTVASISCLSHILPWTALLLFKKYCSGVLVSPLLYELNPSLCYYVPPDERIYGVTQSRVS